MTPTVRELLAGLVAARSTNPPGDERAVAAVIENAARQLGLPDPLRVGPRDERPNLIYEIGAGSPRLLLAAHTDTMPPGDLAEWVGDPWTLREDSGRLYGLGVADMKASIAAMLIAAHRTLARLPESGTFVLAFTADEESGSSEGMEWLCAEGLIEADGAIMTEPSSVGDEPWQHLFVAQRGSCILELVAVGQPGHSGADVDVRQRAGWAFSQALAALHAAEPFRDLAHPAGGIRPTVNIATIVSGGEVPFAHPPDLRAVIEVRTLPGQTQQSVIDALTAVLHEAGIADRAHLERTSGTDWIPAGETVTDPHLLGAARAAWADVLGSQPTLSVLPAGTDSSHVDAIGIPALPAFGPGSLAVAHQPNESLGLEEIETAVDLFEAVIRHYLRGPRTHES